MAVDYKLVKLDGTRIVTGQELKDRLYGFTPLALAPKPIMPTKPVKRDDESQLAFDARYLAWFNGPYQEWLAVCNQRVLDCNAFEQQLREIFQIATWTKTGRTLPDGRPEIGWTMRAVIAPPYASFAQKITGLRSNAPKDLDWICFKTLNT